jgi:hypothetical protein
MAKYISNRPLGGDASGWSDEAILKRLADLNPPPTNDSFDKIFIPEEIGAWVPHDRLAGIIGELERIRGRAVPATTADVLALRMAAQGRPRLFEYLKKAMPFTASERCSIIRLLDFGAESLVLLGEDTGTGSSIAVKVPFVDFTSLAQLDVQQLLRRRERLAREAETLQALAGTVLPKLVDQWIGHNPLFPSGIPSFVRDQERFLIMEYIPGVRLDVYARSLHQQDRACCALRLAVDFAVAFFDFSAAITTRLGVGMAYTDVKPENVLVDGGTLRVVDASSIAPSGGEGRALPVSELYLDPVDHEMWTRGQLVADPAFIVRSVIRAVHSLVSNTTLFVAEAPPPWPPNALADLAPTLDALVADPEIDLARAAAASYALLQRLECKHGRGGMKGVAH